MTEIIFVVEQEPDGGYLAESVSHNIFTQGIFTQGIFTQGVFTQGDDLEYEVVRQTGSHIYLTTRVEKEGKSRRKSDKEMN